MDGGAWWATVHGSQRVGHDFTFTFTFMMEKNLLVENIRANKGICLNFRQSNVKIRLEEGAKILLSTGFNFLWKGAINKEELSHTSGVKQ